MDKVLNSSLKRSVCVYCGSSPLSAPKYIALARDVGETIAERGFRLVYGGGGLGLMGAAALSAHDKGGDVVGIMPRFLETREPPPPQIVMHSVETMHERKMMMFDLSDAFIVLPGGIGTLEEVVETLSWRRLDLHHKPVVFIDTAFWRPFLASLEHLVAENFAPADFLKSYVAVDTGAQAIDAIEAALETTAAGSIADVA